VLGLIDLGETQENCNRQISSIPRAGMPGDSEPAQEGGVMVSAAVSLSGLRAEIDLIEEIARLRLQQLL